MTVKAPRLCRKAPAGPAVRMITRRGMTGASPRKTRHQVPLIAGPGIVALPGGGWRIDDEWASFDLERRLRPVTRYAEIRLEPAPQGTLPPSLLIAEVE